MRAPVGALAPGLGLAGFAVAGGGVRCFQSVLCLL